MASSAGVLAELVDLVASGRITVPIAATYPLDQVREAYAEWRNGTPGERSCSSRRCSGRIYGAVRRL